MSEPTRTRWLVYCATTPHDRNFLEHDTSVWFVDAVDEAEAQAIADTMIERHYEGLGVDVDSIGWLTTMIDFRPSTIGLFIGWDTPIEVFETTDDGRRNVTEAAAGRAKQIRDELAAQQRDEAGRS